MPDVFYSVLNKDYEDFKPSAAPLYSREDNKSLKLCLQGQKQMYRGVYIFVIKGLLIQSRMLFSAEHLTRHHECCTKLCPV